MGYYNGTANDMAAVRSALVNACTLEGWAWNSSTEMLSKGAMFLRLQIVSGCLRLLGRTSATAGDMNHIVQMGPFTGHVLAPLPVMTWPVSYELFIFEQEVYCVINYNVDCYQWCAWGKSTVQGLPGSGMWLGASAAGELIAYSQGINITGQGGLSLANATICPALFWSTTFPPEESRVHSDLDGQGWWMSQSVNGTPIGATAASTLITLLPNAWNSEAVLLPIRAYKVRPSSKISLVADLERARYTRVDNYTPGEVITIGLDRWKVFPWFKKNTAARNGGSQTNHSGTFGWAIRYEGP